MIKENIIANIKEHNVTEYIPASNITKCYSVTFIKEKEYSLFGKVIKKKVSEEIMPFTFKSLEVAKDFCEVCPEVVSDLFINNSDYFSVKYYTYSLIKNDKIIGFIKWDDYYTYDNINDSYDNNIIFGVNETDRIVGEFVKHIILKSWAHTHSIKDIRFENSHEYLSELSKIIEKPKVLGKETLKEWNFKLVAQ